VTVPDLSVRIGSLELAHPIVNASGTYDALAVDGGAGFDDFPYSAYFPKTVTLEPRAGNPPPRVTETPSGMINAIGLANPGIDGYLGQLARLATLPRPVIVSVGGSRMEDYLTVIERLEVWLAQPPGPSPLVAGYELNVSCPNVAIGGLAIGSDPKLTARLTAAARRLTARLLIVKLTPNVTDVVAPAVAAAEAGADALALVNTFKAMVLDPVTLRPFLGNRTGGLCGPAIRPIALRMVAEVAAAVPLPIVGMGGVAGGQDALDFVACGATAVAVGAAVFADPRAPRRIVAELRELLELRGAGGLEEIRGLALG
jgi:dihydroorotate dehydrogenase (NAD+) catalytic subunit